MYPTAAIILTSIMVVALWLVKLVDFLWFRPRKLEKVLRSQGLDGRPYRPFLGDIKDFIRVSKEEQTRSIQFSDDILQHILGYYHLSLANHGPNSFLWWGPYPRLNIADPKLVKEILSKPDVYQKPFPEKGKLIVGGLIFLEGEKWGKHRKIMNPAFHLDKLKNMMQAMGTSCMSMIEKWEGRCNNKNGGCEIDVWPYMKYFAGDVISRTAFGSSYKQGRRIFELIAQKTKLSLQLTQLSSIPLWSYVPTKANRKVKAMGKEIDGLIRGIIERRMKAVEGGEAIFGDDLLGILMETSSRLIGEDGGLGMSIEEVIKECEFIYFAGSDTFAALLVFTMVLLAKHPEWQTRARQEVLTVLDNNYHPTFEALNRLKIVTMIVQEVLRLYPPVPLTVRGATKTVKLGKLTIPAGVHLTLLIGHLHYDPQIWGEDAKEFNPQRFSEGIPHAAKAQSAFIPFISGPRICMGQTFAMIEAKIALANILRSFSFDLSPSYVHAPFAILTLQPQYGAPLILHKL